MIEKEGKYMVLNLIHLTKGTVCMLKNCMIPQVWCHSYEDGIFISVPSPSANECFPDDLDNLFYFARKTGVSLIWLDVDSPISHFKTYD